MRAFARIWAICGICFASGTATAGPDFIETFDAGSFASDAAVVTGQGPLTGVEGELDGNNLVGDFEDMYLIRISEPDAFIASTDPSLGGEATFDSQLWLFSLDPLAEPLAFGLLASDDTPGTPKGASTIRSVATDDSGAMIKTPGLYFLGITGFNDDPLSDGGLIFLQIIPGEISGPDGPGGTLPHVAWTEPGVAGKYRIALSGSEYIECPSDVNHDGVVDPLDSGFVLARFGCDIIEPDCEDADVNQDGIVNPLDVGAVLADFGPCY